MKISLYATSACNLNCPECIMRHQRKNTVGYEISIPELMDFIRITDESGYKFRFTLSGGEPTLWSNLEQGLKLLRSSSICLWVDMYTNAVDTNCLTSNVVGYLDEIRVSKYLSNSTNVDRLYAIYPTKVRVVNREEFWKNPCEKVSRTTPVECLYDKYWYFDRKIYACAHSQSIAFFNGSSVRLFNDLKIGYLEGIEKIKQQQEEDICTYCISNKKVRDKVKLVKNRKEVKLQ